MGTIVQRNAARDTAQPCVAQLDRLRVGEKSLAECKCMHDLTAGAAGKESPAIPREDQSVKGLFERHLRNDSCLTDINDGNLVLPVAGMQDGGETAARMHGDVHGQNDEWHEA